MALFSSKKKSKDIEYPLYDIIPSQETMATLVRYSIHKEVVQIPFSIKLNEKLSNVLLLKAFNIELQRNDALRVRFVIEGAHVGQVGGKIKQYFLPEVKVDRLETMTFRTKEEEYAFFDADAKKPVKYLDGETYRFIVFTTHDGKTGLYFNVSHVLSDALGSAIFFSDLLKVYKALKDGTEMPEPMYSYEEEVKKELAYIGSKKYMKDAEFYKHYWADNGEPFYAGVHGHDILDKARKKDPSIRIPEAYDPTKDEADVCVKYISKELTDGIYEFCKKNLVSPEVVFMYGCRAHASKVNYRADDVLNLCMCSRRASVSTKNTGGCLAQPIQLRVKTPETDSFTDAVIRLATNRNTLIRHMNFPYLHALDLQHKAFGLKISQGPSCFMFSWLPIGYASESEGLDFEPTGYCMGRYVMPLYVIAVPNPKTGETAVYYMRKIAFIKPEHIDLLHENMIKTIEMGLENPDVTVKEILDNLGNFPGNAD